MEINELTAQTSDAPVGDAITGDGHADVPTQETAGEQPKESEKSDADFSETAESGKEEPRGQSAAQNSENARRRREREQHRAQELERARQSAREAAILEVLGGVNPYTREEMKDSRDIEEYLEMRDIEAKGGDPVTDFAKFHKETVRQRDAAAAEKEREAEWYRTDGEAFAVKYPGVDLRDLASDADFMEFAEGKLGEKPLAQIYEGYLGYRDRQEKRAREMAAQMLANKKASPGALASADGGEQDFYSAEEVRRMSPTEVHRNYDKIMTSMKKWK